jgi:hypothetical protein
MSDKFLEVAKEMGLKIFTIEDLTAGRAKLEPGKVQILVIDDDQELPGAAKPTKDKKEKP